MFGAQQPTGTTTASSTSLFGAKPLTQQPATNTMFGTAPATQQATASNLLTGKPFGGGSFPATSTTSAGIFGAQQQGMFGSQQPTSTTAAASTTASSSLFGAKPLAQQPATNTMFGVTPTTQQATASNLLAGKPFGGGSFPATSTTSAGIFGAQQPGMFGSQQPTSTTAAATTTASTSLFGAKPLAQQPATNTMFGAAPATQQATASNLLTGKPFGGGSFPATSTTSAGIFGAQQQGMFGSQQPSAATTTAPAPMFGSQQPASTIAASSTTASTSLFGAKPLTQQPDTNTMFGVAPATQQATASNLLAGKPFGGGSVPATSTTSAGIFGAQQPGMFGSQQPTSTTAAASTTAPAPLFGSQQPSAATTTAPAPLFGSQQPSAATTTAPAPLFGSQQPASTTAPATTTAPAPLFGSQQPTSTTAAATTTAPASLFGSQQPASTTAAVSTTASTSLFGAKPLAHQPATNTMFGVTPATQQATASNLLTGKENQITFKDLEHVLKGLRMDFESQEKQFLDEVDDLNAYDNVLRKAQDKIASLGGDIDGLEREKDRYKYEIEVVEQQQAELDNLVTEMEKVLGLPDYTLGQPIGIRGPSSVTMADVQRQNILQLQINVDAQLKQIDDDVTDICEQLIDLQKLSGTGTNLEPQNGETDANSTVMDQIRQILRKQIETLSWVDKQTDVLNEKVKKTTLEVMTLQK
ncbi:nuclear pore glycoprotein p62 [Ditylenchus destructor]|uniref:Nuclear pore glycoprotein p62 n=1 Tax=Ditylenchus destructor TaxID=166010 RepID=A0AAD4MPH8_9BILA|nr:nuclear pore glycoprotein p62 [Ditylenchus destructor]